MIRKMSVVVLVVVMTLLFSATIAQAQEEVGSYKVFKLQSSYTGGGVGGGTGGYYNPCYTQCTCYRYYHQYPNTCYSYPPRPMPYQPRYQPRYQPIPTPYTYNYPPTIEPYPTNPNIYPPSQPIPSFTSSPYWIYASWILFMLENSQPPDYIYNLPRVTPYQQPLPTEISIAGNAPAQAQPMPNVGVPYDMYGAYQVDGTGSVQYVY